MRATLDAGYSKFAEYLNKVEQHAAYITCNRSQPTPQMDDLYKVARD